MSQSEDIAKKSGNMSSGKLSTGKMSKEEMSVWD